MAATSHQSSPAIFPESGSVPTPEPSLPASSSSHSMCDTSTAPGPSRRPIRFSLSSLRRSLSLQRPSSSDRPKPLEPAPRPIGHQAKVCCVVMTGTMPLRREDDLRKNKSIRKALVDKSNSAASSTKVKRISDGAVATGHGSEQEVKVIKPVVKPKAVHKLKSDLLKPDKARAIVADLKRIELSKEANASAPSCSTDTRPRAFYLSHRDNDDEANAENPVAVVNLATLSFPTSQGGIVGIASDKSGAFEVLADVSGALIRKTSNRETFVAPFDSVGLFLYWWGFELSLPPPVLVKLSGVHSVQQTFLGFLQAFAVTGGAPEIAPFIRYISNYLDMEFAAIQSQNKAGRGVVLAATWLLPVALVPRPWDFPVQEPSSNRVAQFDPRPNPRTSFSDYTRPSVPFTARVPT